MKIKCLKRTPKGFFRKPDFLPCELVINKADIKSISVIVNIEKTKGFKIHFNDLVKYGASNVNFGVKGGNRNFDYQVDDLEKVWNDLKRVEHG